MKLTKKSIKHHVKTAGLERCPFCKVDLYNDNFECVVEYGELDPVENGDIQQRAQCTKCGSRWMDVFKLAEIHEMS